MKKKSKTITKKSNVEEEIIIFFKWQKNLTWACQTRGAFMRPE